MTTHLFAQNVEDDSADQAEWLQSYDAATSKTLDRSTTPLLSPDTLSATQAAIETFKQVIARGGWPQMPRVPLKLGMQNSAVIDLRKRLIASGDLDASAGLSDIFDSFVETGVRRFQELHGLRPTGLITGQTLTALNIPADVRLKQLEVNLVRLRSYSASPGKRYVAANIPGAIVETVEDNIVQTRHAAGVGKIDRQSPIMTTKVIDINFNPFWTVPASIIKKDLIPKMQANPGYLAENKIRIFTNEGQEITSEKINWKSDEATRYQFRQDPGGEFNSLGFVRINIANPYGVYMHDTPAKGIFGDDYRFVSSGCMRVQNVRDYVEWLLKDTPGWSREQIDEAIQSGQRVDARLAKPVPVFWVYITAWATPDGLVQFRDDIYNKDGLGGVPLVTAVQADQ
ncbi:MAG: L,D-transpeptidase family protein [Beijerinckiaceae bacterium]|nr:L,D-transpeptidase family protein [Beijerinckiaceae bacterium]